MNARFFESFSDVIAEHHAEGVHPLAPIARAAASAPPEPEIQPLAERAEENQIRLMMSGYRAGLTLELADRLASVEDRIAGEKRKMAVAERRAADIARMHEQGRLTVMDMMMMPVTDDGDGALVQRLEALRTSLLAQLRGAQESASVASRMAEREDGGRVLVPVSADLEPPPFGSAGDGAARSKAAPPPWAGEPLASCTQCAAMGATERESSVICNHISRHVPTGTGWPEITRATRNAVVAVA